MILCLSLKIVSDMCELCQGKARIDVPGTLHHIIVRGIDRKSIFKDDADKGHL